MGITAWQQEKTNCEGDARNTLDEITIACMQHLQLFLLLCIQYQTVTEARTR